MAKTLVAMLSLPLSNEPSFITNVAVTLKHLHKIKEKPKCLLISYTQLKSRKKVIPSFWTFVTILVKDLLGSTRYYSSTDKSIIPLIFRRDFH